MERNRPLLAQRALLFLTVLISSNGVLQVLKEGGAREEWVGNYAAYQGWLNYVPYLWAVVLAWTLHRVALLRPAMILRKLGWPMILLLAFSAASALWSEGPGATSRAFALMLLMTAHVVFYQHRFGQEALLRHLAASATILLLLSAVFVFALPKYGVSVGAHAGKWQGVFDQKNGLGNFCALTLYLLLFCVSPSRPVLRWGGASLATALCVGSASLTGLASILLLVLTYVVSHVAPIWRIALKFKAALVLLVALLCGGLLYGAITGQFLVELASKEDSYTGRGAIWLYIVSKVAANPWVGYGFGQLAAMNSSDGGDFLSQVGFLVGSAHNGFLEQLFNLGIIGFTLLGIAIYVRLRRASEARATCLLAYLFFYLVLNSFESRTFGPNIYFLVLIVLLLKDGSTPLARSGTAGDSLRLDAACAKS